MTARVRRLSPQYPVYGQGTRLLPGMPGPDPYGPSDFTPSQISEAADSTIGVRGKVMAGIGSDGFPSSDGDEIKVYSNELELRAVDDDVSGNGIFDPRGTQPNVHSDEGAFATRFSLPGYVDRELFFRPSEVTDLTTGKPVMFVPGGAVAMDDITPRAMRDTLSWYLPPGVSPVPVSRGGRQQTFLPAVPTAPVPHEMDAVAMPRTAPLDPMIPATDGLGYFEMDRNTKIWGGVALLAAAGAFVYLATRKR